MANALPVAAPRPQAVPTCSVCEKVLVEEMRRKYPLFDLAYAAMHRCVDLWLWIGLSREERRRGEDNAVRKCSTCEKVNYRRLRAKSQQFNSFYKLLDATLEGWLDKFLDENDRDAAFKRDPAHASQLLRFNPRSYHLGQDFILAVKFDGCIAQEVQGGFPDTIGEPVARAKDLLEDLKACNCRIVLFGWRSTYATRGNPWYRKQAEKWLHHHRIPYDYFHDGKSPLIADRFVSDRIAGETLAGAHPAIRRILEEDTEKTYVARRHV